MNGARGFALRDDAVEWLWSLHENVNRERAVVGLTREECDTFYSARTSVEMNQDISALNTSLSRATQTGAVDPIAVRTWKAVLSLIRRLVNV